jgi:hypothetical protein
MRNINQPQMHQGSRPIAQPGLRVSLTTISNKDFPPIGETQEQTS